MSRMRALVREHRRMAILLLALAFSIKALVPAGFMVATSDRTVLTVAVCADATGSARSMQVVIPGKGGQDGQTSHEGKKDGHCAFSGLGKVAVGGADALLLALAIAYILVLGLAPAVRQPRGRIRHLRPPLRGPPAAA